MHDELPQREPETVRRVGAMPYRRFGATGLQVSEVGFGAWGIGGQAYGASDRGESLRALARAEELGCNFVDTAAVYGDSELVLGEFLRDRRSRWIVSTKFSGQHEGLAATLERQLQRLGTDHVDFYMIHWAPGRSEQSLYESLYAVKRAGKARFIGVSLYSVPDIDGVLRNPLVDGFMVAISLLDPDPFRLCYPRLRDTAKAIIARSSLKEGFLTGKFPRTTTFTDPADQRSKWSAARIARTVDLVEHFRFLEPRAGSLTRAAFGYPLSYPEVSTAVAGTRSLREADANFGSVPGYRLTAEELQRIAALQDSLGLRVRAGLLGRLLQVLRG
jgi:myo-inositol catabolism protein IolS